MTTLYGIKASDISINGQKITHENGKVSIVGSNELSIGQLTSNTGGIKVSDSNPALILKIKDSEKIVCWENAVDVNGGILKLRDQTANTISLEGASENTIKMIGSTNDYARIRMHSRDETTNNGALEIATCDDSSEPIYIRQYQGDFKTLARELTLLDSTGNTYVPGTLFVKDQDILSDVNNLKALL